MARVHYWQFLLNKEGNPIPDADIYIYESGSETPMYIYTSETGGTASNDTPHIVSNSAGYFEFWIGDENEVNGYGPDVKFKIAWQKFGISSGYIDFVEVFPHEPYIVASGFTGNLDSTITTLQKLAVAVDQFTYSLETSGFVGNLDSSVDDVQKLADFVDALPIFRIYENRAAMLAATNNQDGIPCSVISEPSNIYIWNDTEGKWAVRSGNIYTTSNLPSSTDFYIANFTFVINSDTGEQIYWEE